MRNKGQIIAVALIALFLIVPKSSGQDLMDVIVSLKNIDKKINELESTQKKDVAKLQTQIATGGGTDNSAQFDTLKNQVGDLQKAVGSYGELNNSFIALSEKFDKIEQRLSTESTTPTGSGRELASSELLAELKNLTGELKEVINDRPATPAPNAPPAVKADAKPAAAGLDLKLYGFIKLESMFDNSEVVKGDWLLYANKGNTPQASQNVFTMNARDSRLGLKIGGPTFGKSGKITALVEVDFTGGFPNSSTAARQPILNLRHAWLELGNPSWQARFGQDWALISGPFPNSTSFVVNGGCGNLWMRFPQISLTYKAAPMKYAISVNRPIAGNVKYDEYAAGDLDPVDDGEKTGMPWYMGRIWFTKGNHTISASGHYGQEMINDLSVKSHRMDSYSLNGDLVSKFGHLSFTSRAFYGANLNSFLGGVLQGFVSDSTSVDNVESIGGWSQLAYDFNSTWTATAGFGIDDPKNDNLKTGMRSQNKMIFANVIFKIQKSVELILEGEQMNTSYLNAKAGDNLRFQFASYFRF